MGPLIDATELAPLLGDAPPLLLDVRWLLNDDSGHALYLAGHLPGAVWVDLDAELAGPPGAGGRHPLPDPEVFGEAMRRVGVTADRPVVAYDGGSGLGAARLWWLLTDAGHPDVRVLNGGYPAWVAAGLAVETGEVAPARGDFRGVPGGRRVVDADGVVAHLAASGAVYDVRAADRYRGENETIDPVAGHIPGARSLPYATIADADGFPEAGELKARLGALATGDVVSCGSGITASAVILAAEQAGVEGVVLYAGSWSGWITDPSRQVATGPHAGALDS